MQAKKKEYLENHPDWFDLIQLGQAPELKQFGDIKGIPLFTTFANRKECVERGVHRNTQAGIWGSSKYGAYSIVLSGGYEDDIDEGDKILYTGTGGYEPDSSFASGRQVDDQDPDYRDNAALFKSAETKRHVRVIRGENEDSPWAPAKGLRYDGLYVVKKAYMTEGKSKHQICRYELERLPNQPPIPKRW